MRESGGRTSESTIEAVSQEAAFIRFFTKARGCGQEKARRAAYTQKRQGRRHAESPPGRPGV